MPDDTKLYGSLFVQCCVFVWRPAVRNTNTRQNINLSYFPIPKATQVMCILIHVTFQVSCFCVRFVLSNVFSLARRKVKSFSPLHQKKHKNTTNGDFVVFSPFCSARRSHERHIHVSFSCGERSNTLKHCKANFSTNKR